MNYAFTVIDGKPHVIKRKSVNIGLAIDIEKKDGSRSLLVPSTKTLLNDQEKVKSIRLNLQALQLRSQTPELLVQLVPFQG